MYQPPIDSDIAERIKRIEARSGKQVLLRRVRSDHPCFRGRVRERRTHLILEYRDETAGYFWDRDIIRELLAAVEKGIGINVTLYDHDLQYVEVPLRGPRARHRPPGDP